MDTTPPSQHDPVERDEVDPIRAAMLADPDLLLIGEWGGKPLTSGFPERVLEMLERLGPDFSDVKR